MSKGENIFDRVSYPFEILIHYLRYGTTFGSCLNILPKLVKNGGLFGQIILPDLLYYLGCNLDQLVEQLLSLKYSRLGHIFTRNELGDQLVDPVNYSKPDYEFIDYCLLVAIGLVNNTVSQSEQEFDLLLG